MRMLFSGTILLKKEVEKYTMLSNKLMSSLDRMRRSLWNFLNFQSYYRIPSF